MAEETISKNDNPFQKLGLATKSVEELMKLMREGKYAFMEEQLKLIDSGSREKQLEALGNISNLVRAFSREELSGESARLIGLLRKIAPFISSDDEKLPVPAWFGANALVCRTGIITDGSLGKEMMSRPGDVPLEMLLVVLDAANSATNENLTSAALKLADEFIREMPAEQRRAFMGKARGLAEKVDENSWAGEAALTYISRAGQKK